MGAAESIKNGIIGIEQYELSTKREKKAMKNKERIIRRK